MAFVLKPIVKSIRSSIKIPAVKFLSPFDPSQLFRHGEQGVWYDPSDLSTLYQDAAGTIPVTADGQPVGRMLDKSGNGNHATQSVAASRPVYRTDNVLHWLEADGVDDYMTTTFSPGTSNISIAAGWTANLNADIVAGSQTSGNRAYLARRLDKNAGGFANLSFSTVQGATWVNPIVSILEGIPDTSVTLYRGGTQEYTNPVTGNGGGNVFYIMGLNFDNSATNQMQGNLYGLILRSETLGADIDNVSDYLSIKAGVQL